MHFAIKTLVSASSRLRPNTTKANFFMSHNKLYMEGLPAKSRLPNLTQ